MLPYSAVWIIAVSVHQDIYNTFKEGVLNRMRASLSRILVLPKEQEDSEELYDISRAYGLLLNACGSTSMQQQKLLSSKVS